MNITHDGWEAEVMLSNEDDPSGLTHVQARVKGTSRDLALAGARWVLAHLAEGREAFMRVEPEAETYRNFNTKIERHFGFVRFSYLRLHGRWRPMDRMQPESLASAPIGFGTPEAAT